MIYPKTFTARPSDGLTDGQADLLGGNFLEVSRVGTYHGAVYQANVRTIIIPASEGGGNVTYVRGVFYAGVVWKYNGFATGPSVRNVVDDTNFLLSVVNEWTGSIHRTVIVLTTDAAINADYQIIYSYRSGELTKPGDPTSGWPQLHIDPMYGTANDGDQYIMMACYHAYLTTGDPKYEVLRKRIGTALVDAGFAQPLRLRFPTASDPEASEDDLVFGHMYNYYHPNSEFSWRVEPLKDSLQAYPGQDKNFYLRVTASINPDGPPYEYGGFGVWPDVNISAPETLLYIALIIMADGSARPISLSTNLYADGRVEGEVVCRIPLGGGGYDDAFALITPDMLWKLDNVVADPLHKDFYYQGFYGNTLMTEVPGAQTAPAYRCDWSHKNNPYYWAGFYFGVNTAECNSTGTSGFTMNIFASIPINIILTVSNATTDYPLTMGLSSGWNFVFKPWAAFGAVVHPITDFSIDLPNDFQYAGTESVTITEYVEVCTTTTRLSSTGIRDGVWVFLDEPELITETSCVQQPVTTIEERPIGFFEGSEGYLLMDTVLFGTYDDIIHAGNIDPPAEVLGGLQFQFKPDISPYDIYIGYLDIFRTTDIDGPISDPVKYTGIPRWTYKWNGAGPNKIYGAWRGPTSVGYNWIGGWIPGDIVNENGKPIVTGIREMLVDSQAAYHEQFPANSQGLFIPLYGRPSWESITTGGYVNGVWSDTTYNKWYFSDTDDWYGYHVRAMITTAHDYYMTGNNAATLDAIIAWLKNNILYISGKYHAPSEYMSNTGLPGYSYRPIYNMCLAQVFLYKYWRGGGGDNATWARTLLNDAYTHNIINGSGELEFITRVEEGDKYTYATVNITGDGVNATATANIRGGKIRFYTVTNPGSGYTFMNISISGDGHGAVAKPTLTQDLNGAFDPHHTGWEVFEIYNTLSMVVNGPPNTPSGNPVVNYSFTAIANDVTNLQALHDFVWRNAGEYPAMLATETGVPFHEFGINPYHDDSGGIDNPISRDTVTNHNIWTESIGPCFYAAVEYGRRSGNWSWCEQLYALCAELAGLNTAHKDSKAARYLRLAYKNNTTKNILIEKEINDSVVALDYFNRVPSKNPLAVVVPNDEFHRVMNYYRTFNDRAFVFEQIRYAPAAVKIDSPHTAEVFNRVVSYTRAFNDVMHAVDIFKVLFTTTFGTETIHAVNNTLSHNLFSGAALNDASHTAEVFKFNMQKQIAVDTVVANDSGKIICQDYGIDYFADDYVGQYVTFT